MVITDSRFYSENSSAFEKEVRRFCDFENDPFAAVPTRPLGLCFLGWNLTFPWYGVLLLFVRGNTKWSLWQSFHRAARPGGE
jgi:hypothetical protein